MISSMEEADMLRLNTVKETISILTPMQCKFFGFHGFAKKLHLCTQAWGKESDNDHGRNQEQKMSMEVLLCCMIEFDQDFAFYDQVFLPYCHLLYFYDRLKGKTETEFKLFED